MEINHQHITRGHRFPWIIGGMLVLVLVLYRVAIGAGWGLQIPDATSGSVKTGILANFGDNLSYSSWPQQVKQGRWRFDNRYTTDKHRAVYVNVYFAVVGHISAWLGVQPYGVMVWIGILMALLTVVSLYHCALVLGFPVTWARWSSVFVAFASGLSAPWLVVCRKLGWSGQAGADVHYLDAIGYSTYFAYPFHTFALGCLGLLMWAWVCLDRAWFSEEFGKYAPSQSGDKNEKNRNIRNYLMLSVALALLLAWSRPYEPLLFLVSWGVWIVLFWMLRWWLRFRGNVDTTPESGWKYRVWGLVSLGLVIGSGIGYSLWVSSLPVWNSFAGASLSLQKGPWFWVLGYGMLLPAALLGVWAIYHQSIGVVAIWPVLWTWGMVGLLVMGIPQTKICNGGALPMCLVAGAGWGWLWQQVSLLTTPKIRWLAQIGYTVATGLFFCTSVWLLVHVFRPHGVDGKLFEVAKVIRQQAGHKTPVVLCDVEAGAILPGWFGFQVFAGNGGLTPNFEQKREMLAHTGIEVPLVAIHPDFRDRVWTLLLRLIQQTQADFVLLRSQSAAAALFRPTPLIRKRWTHGMWVLWQVSRGEDSRN